MSDYNVGYGKPPRHTRFQKGVCPNPNGRGRRGEHPAAGQIDEILGAKITFRENGRLKTATRAELSVRRLIASALNGNVSDAAQLLTLREHGRRSDISPLVIRILGGLPDRIDDSK